MQLPIERKIHDYVEAKHPFFSTSVDFYLKWIPYATVFILNLEGINNQTDPNAKEERLQAELA